MSFWNLLCGLLAGICTFFSAAVIPFLRGKLTDQRWKRLLEWSKIAVEAAEQRFGGGTGEKKKEYVALFLRSRGAHLSEEALDTLIESAVAARNAVKNAVETSESR